MVMRNYFAPQLRKTENVVIPSFVETTSYEVVDHCRGQNVGDTLTAILQLNLLTIKRHFSDNFQN